jgi:hypothetical protein
MTPSSNQNPEQIARDLIDKQLEQAGRCNQKMRLISHRGRVLQFENIRLLLALQILFLDRKHAGDPFLLIITRRFQRP